MGFDLHGINPKRNTAKPAAITDFLNKDGWVNWEKLKRNDTTDEEGNTVRSEEHEAYWEAYHKWEDDNPGGYFRNNVWWWRPLWGFITVVCDDILTERDKEKGEYNDGYEIDEKKAKVISERLQLFIDNGDAERWGKERQETLDAQEDEECNICDGTGNRQEPPETGAGDVKCNGCQGKGTVRPFNTQYPFDIENVQEFIKFAAQSGGFTIC